MSEAEHLGPTSASEHDRPSRDAREVVRASTPVAGIVASLLLTLYPRSELYRVGAGVERLILDPAPSTGRLDKLKSLLFDLADRPEWRSRHLVTREVGDADGLRLEALLPVPPGEYRTGAQLVGPFETGTAADEWGADHAVSTLSYDVFSTGGVWVCDLFDLPGA